MVAGGPARCGDAVRLGRRTTAGVAGLDLVGLLDLVGMQTAIRQALDPKSIFNPGTG